MLDRRVWNVMLEVRPCGIAVLALPNVSPASKRTTPLSVGCWLKLKSSQHTSWFSANHAARSHLNSKRGFNIGMSEDLHKMTNNVDAVGLFGLS